MEEYFFHVQVYVYHHGHIKLTSLNSRSINSCRFSSLERCTLFFLSSSCLIYNIKCKQFLCPVLGRMQRNLRRIICSRQFMSWILQKWKKNKTSWINHEVAKDKYFVCTILCYRHDCLLFINLTEHDLNENEKLE